ncbi:MAG TPA: hypothetical protein VK879_12320 [Candidatus Sulfomarinibacteraceae bacterium]|nr:hypothetical protein [Candidatus Sulfomarinibacteraceae bacterium]
MSRGRLLIVVAGILVAFALIINFLNFHAARSTTETNHSLSVYRVGERLPDSMAPGFTLSFAVSGEEQLASALTDALQAELEQLPNVGAVTAVSTFEQNQAAPLLLVDLNTDRLWTPFYGRATVQAQLFYAYDGDAPWPLDEAVVFEVSPALKADGQFTTVDTTWGLISKPAYTDHLAQALAQQIAAAMQDQVLAAP